MDEFDEFSLITKLDQQKLTHLLISIPGNKELIVETQLLRPLDRICSMSTLRSNNCIRVQQFFMDKEILWDENAEERVFFVRPTIEISRKICELIRSNPERHYSIIQVGGSKNFFIREIEKNALYGLVDLYDFNLTLIHMESDLFSMELPQYSLNMFSNYFDTVVRALWQLQILYGEIQTTYCLGESSTYIHKLYKRLCINLTEPKATPDQPISHLFIFDRRLDIPSVLLTGLTYESILNDVFKYNCGKIAFGAAVNEKLAQRQNPSNSIKSQPKIYSLNNMDPIFSAIRNSHMTSVFPFLSTKAKFIQCSFDRVTSIKKVDEMKTFVSKELANLREERKQLEIHICACEYILEKIGGTNQRFVIEHDIIKGQFQDPDVFAFLQKMISTKTNPWSILQLATLWSLRKNGISPKCMQQFQELFLHRYGFELISALYGLRINGLFFENGLLYLIPPPITNALKANFGKQKLSSEYSSKRNELDGRKGNRFSQLVTSTIEGFQLCSDQNKKRNEMEKSTKSEKEVENGLGFVFSDAYIPLITSIVNRTVTKGWDEGHLKNILGNRAVFASDPNAKAPDNRIRRAIVVCFVGGVTYAEIASLRCFSQQRDFRLIILTTHIINREEFLKSFAKIL